MISEGFFNHISHALDRDIKGLEQILDNTKREALNVGNRLDVENRLKRLKAYKDELILLYYRN